jgi:hypothetical protein
MQKNSSKFLARIGSLFLGILLLISASVTLAPQKVDAGGLPVFDYLNSIINTISQKANLATAVATGGNFTISNVLNPIAWAVAKSALQTIVKSTVNSINKGPNGTPGYATNLNTLMQQVGDTAANNFISQLSTNSSIKSPFQTSVATAVGNNYLQSSGSNGFFNSNPYTLNKVATNDTAFLGGNFSQGGFMALASAFSNPANNPYGAAELATMGLNSQVANAQSVQKQELTYGQGFLASRGSCNKTTTGGSTAQTASANSAASALTSTLTSLTSLSANSTCQSSPIQTPGSTIKASLDKSLGSGIDTLVNAHTFDEIVSSILSQLVNQVITSGLSGTSQPTTTTVPATATTPATTTNVPSYFDQTDTSTAGVNSQLSTSFVSTISGQITQLQQFQTNWTTINNAALAANASLSTCGSGPYTQNLITTEVQPVLQQAATELQAASSGISSLQSIQQQLNTASSSTDPTDALANVSTAYTNELAVLPSASDISYAQNQSIDTGTTTPSSLYTQMTQLAASTASCAVPSVPSTIAPTN